MYLYPAETADAVSVASEESADPPSVPQPSLATVSQPNTHTPLESEKYPLNDKRCPADDTPTRHTFCYLTRIQLHKA